MDGTPSQLPEPPAGIRLAGSFFLPPLGRLFLRLGGWRIEGSFPQDAKFVAVVAPHSSNWDFFLGLAVKFATRLKVSWLGQHTLFRGPFGTLLRSLGGIPVDRRSANGVVGDCVEALRRSTSMMLALAPEGTRKPGRTWRSGFYRIAVGAGVPIFPVAFDWKARVVRLFPVYEPSGDYEADLPRLLAIYQDIGPKNG